MPPLYCHGNGDSSVAVHRIPGGGQGRVDASAPLRGGNRQRKVVRCFRDFAKKVQLRRWVLVMMSCRLLVWPGWKYYSPLRPFLQKQNSSQIPKYSSASQKSLLMLKHSTLLRGAPQMNSEPATLNCLVPFIRFEQKHILSSGIVCVRFTSQTTSTMMMTMTVHHSWRGTPTIASSGRLTFRIWLEDVTTRR